MNIIKVKYTHVEIQYDEKLLSKEIAWGLRMIFQGMSVEPKILADNVRDRLMITANLTLQEYDSLKSLLDTFRLNNLMEERKM